MRQKPESALALLPASSHLPKSPMLWAKMVAKQNSKPGKFSQVKAKQALKIVAAEGKEIIAFEVAKDGSFRIELASKPGLSLSKGQNPWDKVLTDD